MSEMRYLPYGQAYWQSGASQTDFSFTGQRMDGSDLLDYNARYYDPYLNRFLAPDSIVPEKIQGIQAWDRYAYANNNPVRFTDPSGHCIGPLLAICIAVGTFIVDHAAIISTIAVVGAITSFIGPSNPDPVLMNDPVASQQALENSSFQAGLWLTGGQATFEFGYVMSGPSLLTNSVDEQVSPKITVPNLPQRNNPNDKTTGVLVAGGQETTLVSGWNGPASQMPSGSSGFDIVTRTHVEGHASALMNQNGWRSGTLFINNPPCTSCSTLLPRMLPPHSTLQVIVPGKYDRLFISQ